MQTTSELLTRLACEDERDTSPRSHNLWLWIKYQIKHNRSIAYDITIMSSAPWEEHPRASEIVVGARVEDYPGEIYGSRLSGIIARGGREGTWAFPVNDTPHDITEAFLAAYDAKGKCAWDTAHTLYHDTSRYVQDQDLDVRRCRWCGRIETLHRYQEVTERQVWLEYGATLPSSPGTIKADELAARDRLLDALLRRRACDGAAGRVYYSPVLNDSEDEIQGLMAKLGIVGPDGDALARDYVRNPKNETDGCDK